MTDTAGLKEKTLIDPPSSDEMQILTLVAQGLSNRQIAAELGLDLETVKWRARRLYTSLGVSGRRLAVERALTLGLLVSERALAMPEHNFPLSSGAFFGREEELDDLRSFLIDESRRLATLLGPDGIGKTRLALQAATAVLQERPDVVRDGVVYVPLGSLGDPAFIPASLALALDFSPYESRVPPEEQLSLYLREKKILFVLDDFDSLSGQQSAGLIERLLSSCPGVQFLVTSRLWLEAASEQLFWLEGLSFPLERLDASSQVDLVKAQTFASVQLFVEAARRLQPDYQLQADQAAAVVRICQELEGVPLAIELVAVWTGLLEPAGILEALFERGGKQATKESDSEVCSCAWAAAELSWRMLTDIERRSLQQLSIFPDGGCGIDHAAAAEVCDLSLSTLVELVEKNWLQRDEDGRFLLPDLLRRYAAVSLAGDPGLEDKIRERHSQFYCAALEASWDELHSAQRQAAVQNIECDLENTRLACCWAAEHDHYSRLQRPVDSMGLYYRLRGRNRAGDAYFSQLGKTLEESGVSGIDELLELQLVRARLLKWRAIYRGLLGDVQVSDDLMDQSDTWLDALQIQGQDVHSERAMLALSQAATRLFFVQDPAEACEYYSHSLELYRELGDAWGEALASSSLARALREAGELEKAREFALQALDLRRQNSDEVGHSSSLTLLASIMIRQGDLDGVETLLRESLEVENTPLDLTARSLAYLGWVRYLRGELTHAVAALGRGSLVQQEIGSPQAGTWTARQAVIELHLGRYPLSLDSLNQAVRLARASQVEQEDRFSARRSWLRGAIQLAEGDYQEAYDLLHSGMRRWKISMSEHFFTPQAWLGMAAHYLEKPSEARRRSKAEMKAALEAHALPGLLAGMACMALWLSDDGQIQRAVEIYATLSRQSLFANSRWFQAVAGDALEAIALDLPVDEMEAALARGRQLDLWQAAQDML